MEKVHELDRFSLSQSPVIHASRFVIKLEINREDLGVLCEQRSIQLSIQRSNQERTNICLLAGSISRCRRTIGIFEAEEFLQKVECILINI
jgi:hypothetical protein